MSVDVTGRYNKLVDIASRDLVPSPLQLHALVLLLPDAVASLLCIEQGKLHKAMSLTNTQASFHGRNSKPHLSNFVVVWQWPCLAMALKAMISANLPPHAVFYTTAWP